MSYFVKKLATAKRSWKLQFIDYLPGPGDKRKITDIPTTEYLRLGFHYEMSYEDAKNRQHQLNDIEHLKRTEEKRIVIAKRIGTEDKTLNAFLNKADVEEFEQAVLYATAADRLAANKIESHWRAAKRILFELKIKPEDWAYQKRRFYEVFSKRRMSPSYAQKLIAIINQWGKFYCRKYRLFFEELPFPTGREKERIADAYFEKDENGRVSDPLTPDMLERSKNNLKTEWYRWFYLSVWFGLRPFEVDQLLKPSSPRTWHIGREKGVHYLGVYQTKLMSIPQDKRTKIIPCITPEQEAGLKMIAEGGFKRPSHVKHIRPYFGENMTLYGGRKGFPQLMRSLGQTIEDYTSWMGHQTMERTFKDYKDKQAINFTPVTRTSGALHSPQ